MSEIEKLIDDINKLRDSLYHLIKQHDYDLNDSEVLEASKQLNIAIVSYNELINERMSG